MYNNKYMADIPNIKKLNKFKMIGDNLDKIDKIFKINMTDKDWDNIRNICKDLDKENVTIHESRFKDSVNKIRSITNDEKNTIYDKMEELNLY